MLFLVKMTRQGKDEAQSSAKVISHVISMSVGNHLGKFLYEVLKSPLSYKHMFGRYLVCFFLRLRPSPWCKC